MMPILPLMTAGGSTGVTDINWNVPTVLFGWLTMPLGIVMNAWPVAACSCG